MDDRRLGKWLLVLLAFPLALAMCSGDRYRYPCQDPANWDDDKCKLPVCDVNRSCPEHIFKGQRDPRMGPYKDDTTKILPSPICPAPVAQGATCGK